MLRISRPPGVVLAWAGVLAAALAFMGAAPRDVAAQARVYTAQCTFNADCQAPLVCAAARCREACQTDRDCHNGWVCERQVWAGGRMVERYRPGLAVVGDQQLRGVCVAPGAVIQGEAAAPPYAAAAPVARPVLWVDNMARYGTNIGGRIDLDAADPGLCEAACAKEGACRSWTYVKPGYQAPHAVCWIKSDNPAPIREDCCVTGAK